MNAHLIRTSTVTTFVSLLLCFGFPNAVLAQTGCTVGMWTPVSFGGARTGGTGPAVVEFNGNLWVFVTRTSDRVYAGVFRPGVGWLENYISPAQNVKAGGNGPAAVVFSGNLYLFVTDPQGRILVNILPGNVAPRPSNFTGWNEIPGNFIGTREPGATQFFDDFVGTLELDLFARASNGTIWVNILSGENWGGWNEVPGSGITTHGPVPITQQPFGSSILHLFVRGTDGGLYENFRRDGDWGTWRRIGTNLITSAPAPIIFFPRFPPGVFTRGIGGRVFLQGNIGEEVTEVPPGQNAATATAAPAALTIDGDLYVFVTGRGDRILCNILRP